MRLAGDLSCRPSLPGQLDPAPDAPPDRGRRLLRRRLRRPLPADDRRGDPHGALLRPGLRARAARRRRGPPGPRPGARALRGVLRPPSPAVPLAAAGAEPRLAREPDARDDAGAAARWTTSGSSTGRSATTCASRRRGSRSRASCRRWTRSRWRQRLHRAPPTPGPTLRKAAPRPSGPPALEAQSARDGAPQKRPSGTPPTQAANRPPALYEGGWVVKWVRDRWSWAAGVSWGLSGAHLSIASWWEDRVVWEPLRWRISVRAVYAARAGVAPAGAKGWFRVSMCQIASARRRAMSTWATLAPRCRPSRALLRW